GRDHLHIHPAAAWPVVRTRGEPGVLGVVWNGEPVGFYSAATLARVLAPAAAGPAGARSFAIHSLLGHSADETVKILAAAGLKRGFFWLHDFASLCAGFHLLRDDVEDCAAPPPTSAACAICTYGPWRGRHLAEHERLFKRLDLTVVSPSRPTLDLWRRSWSFPTQGEVVLPHARLVRRGPAPIRAKGPFRLGFAGVPAAHKGWPVFRELAERFAEDPRYQFIHFGLRTIGGLPIGFEPVTVTAAKPKAMQQALAAAGLDALLVWPLCRETFSFTAYEGVAAGAAILTNPDSGNVAAFVADGGHGRVVAGEAALTALFESGAVLKLARARRKPALHDLKFSGLTVDLLPAEAAA
ncbi:MAG: glycosyl transferase, group 1 family protein, partial [Phenylobacterium sp.]|nr:glycosyl transferase, group 1 family protein [Phenylobacterium sp.]